MRHLQQIQFCYFLKTRYNLTLNWKAQSLNENFNDAKLNNVIFDKCYCVGTKFNRANMRGTTFGVLPKIKCDK